MSIFSNKYNARLSYTHQTHKTDTSFITDNSLAQSYLRNPVLLLCYDFNTTHHNFLNKYTEYKCKFIFYDLTTWDHFDFKTLLKYLRP